MQLIKGRKSLTELVPFGETVIFKIPKTSQAVGSFEEKRETGVWIGTTILDGMSVIGTPTGVYKVGTIRRKPDGEQWSQEMIKNIAGNSQQRTGSLHEEDHHLRHEETRRRGGRTSSDIPAPQMKLQYLAMFEF